MKKFTLLIIGLISLSAVAAYAQTVDVKMYNRTNVNLLIQNKQPTNCYCQLSTTPSKAVTIYANCDKKTPYTLNTTTAPTTVPLNEDNNGINNVCFEGGSSQGLGSTIPSEVALIISEGELMFIMRSTANTPFDEVISSNLPNCPSCWSGE